MRASRCLLYAGVAAWSQLLNPAVGLDNGVGRTPPLGWASWNTFVDVALNESVIRETAEAMVAHGLDKVGYRYINVDCGWSHVNRTAAGEIQADPLRFPSGMKALADFIHSKNLLFGLYTARGPRECCGRTGYNGSVHADRDAATFAGEWCATVFCFAHAKVHAAVVCLSHILVLCWSTYTHRRAAWGVDYLKVDRCDVVACVSAVAMH